VVLITRAGCHLCEQAAAVIDAAVAEAGLDPAEVAVLDVDADESLARRYTDHVPVVFVGGRLLAYWTLRDEQFRAALAGAPFTSPPAL